jgi:hypothetical protein
MKYFLSLIFICCLFACSTTNKPEEKISEEIVEMESMGTVSDSSYVFFKYPTDGATVPSPVYVEMGVKGMQIEPAGEVREGYGHHHLLINQASWPEGTVIPASDSTIHFGKGQTDASIELEAGEYMIALQFADGVHSSYGKSMSASIKISVE